MAEQTGRLEVTVATGFEDSEFYVMVPGGPSAFVKRDLVSVDRVPDAGAFVEGRVTVYVLEEGDRDALIELPGEPVIGGLRARVDRSLLDQPHNR